MRFSVESVGSRLSFLLRPTPAMEAVQVNDSPYKDLHQLLTSISGKQWKDRKKSDEIGERLVETARVIITILGANDRAILTEELFYKQGPAFHGRLLAVLGFASNRASDLYPSEPIDPKDTDSPYVVDPDNLIFRYIKEIVDREIIVAPNAVYPNTRHQRFSVREAMKRTDFTDRQRDGTVNTLAGLRPRTLTERQKHIIQITQETEPR